MKIDPKKSIAIAVITFATILSGANSGCRPTTPATCNADECTKCYCLGPENYGVNASVRPYTCSGDFTLTLAGLYWGAKQDGLEYAVINETIGTDSFSGNRELNTLVDAHYLTPDFGWDFGFKLGAGYNMGCDSWDFGLLWTRLHQGAQSQVEEEFDSNHALIPLWSAFQYPNAGNAPILFANRIDTFWKLELDLVDIELGREFWTSKYLTLRPHIGFRVAHLDQDFDIEHKGGSFSDPGLNFDFNNLVQLTNDYHGAGLRSGLDTIWHLGCGFGLYGETALSIVYGRFKMHHDETIKSATAPFSRYKIFETSYSLRSSRAMLDLALGVRWAAKFCDCKYFIGFSLGWEQHIFFNQNQLWRVVRLGGVNGSSEINTSGENVFHQRRGALGTRGWTLTGNLAF